MTKDVSKETIEAAIESLRYSVATAANDDRTEPGSELRSRHANRSLAMSDAADLLSALSARVEELEEALKPFAIIGEIVSMQPFGEGLFNSDHVAFGGAARYAVNDTDGELKWKDFRRARSVLFPQREDCPKPNEKLRAFYAAGKAAGNGGE